MEEEKRYTDIPFYEKKLRKLAVSMLTTNTFLLLLLQQNTKAQKKEKENPGGEDIFPKEKLPFVKNP